VSDQTEIATSRIAAYKLTGIQLAITIVIALLLYALFDDVPAYSALLGGLACVLPNAFFVGYALRGSGQQSPLIVVRWFYVGEAVKLIMTCLIFAACFVLVKPLHVISLFVTYLVMMMINLAGLVLIANNHG